MTDAATIENRDSAEERPGGRRNLAVISGLVGLLALLGGSLFSSLFTTSDAPETPPDDPPAALTPTAEDLLSGQSIFSEPDSGSHAGFHGASPDAR